MSSGIRTSGSGPAAADPDLTGANRPMTDTAREQGSAVKDSAASAVQDVAGTTKDQAGAVKDTAVSAASDVAGTAKDQAGQVAGEMSRQARQLADSTRQQLTTQTSQQKDRAVSGLRQLASGMTDMASGNGQPSGLAPDLAREAGQRLHRVAGYLEGREPTELLDEVRSWARRRPAAFLAGAAAAGFVVGRLVKGATSASSGGGGGSDASWRDAADGPRSYAAAPSVSSPTGVPVTPLADPPLAEPALPEPALYVPPSGAVDPVVSSPAGTGPGDPLSTTESTEYRAPLAGGDDLVDPWAPSPSTRYGGAPSE